MCTRLLAVIVAPMSITAIIENETVKLPIHVPDGTKVEITLSEEGAPSKQHRHEWMRKYIGAAKDLPDDLAPEHDHYIHGTRETSRPIARVR